MSNAIYTESGALRFWSEIEILLRQQFKERITTSIKEVLLLANPSWQFLEVEGPILTPLHYLSDEHTDKDVFVTNHEAGNDDVVLRAETTASSYAAAKYFSKRVKRLKPPFCVYQMGKSFRRELSDGANWSNYRAMEFYQLEFQCIYSDSTKFPYIEKIPQFIASILEYCVGQPMHIELSDRLPSYSEKTVDVVRSSDKLEIASCSIRNDYDKGFKVFEVAIGMDRLVEISDER